jgi:adhesin/invasin
MRVGSSTAGLVVVLAVAAACGGGGDGGGGTNPVVAIAKTGASSGDAQTAEVNSALAAPLRVLVTEDGTPKAAVTVQWSTTNGATNPTSFLTDVDGIATSTWTLGTTAGAQTAKATLAGAVGSPVTFTATATPGSAAALLKQAGDGQGQVVNTAFTTALQVRVNDAFGNAVPNAAVQWAGSGTVQPASASSNTNGSGLASVTATALGNAGAGQVQASVTGVAGNVTFNLTVGHRKASAGNIFFVSARNGTQNPAIDTLAVGQTMLWVNQAGTHTVESTGIPSFTSSGTLTLYTVIFNAAGTYQYDCGVHGAAMTGRVVVE